MSSVVMSPIEMRKYIMAEYRNNWRDGTRIAHEKCRPQLSDYSSLVYSGGCLAHHWSGEPFLDAIERVNKRKENNEVLSSIHTHNGYGSLLELLDEMAPCECCSILLEVTAIGNGCETEADAIKEAAEFVVVIENCEKKELFRIKAGSTNLFKNTLGWFAVPTSYIVEKM